MFDHRALASLFCFIFYLLGHLEEMIHQLDEFSENWKPHAEKVIEIEKDLYINWVNAITEEVMKLDYA